MSAFWTWLVSNVSDLSSSGDTLRLVMGAGMLLSGSALLWIYLALRHRGHRRVHQKAAAAADRTLATVASATVVASVVPPAAQEHALATVPAVPAIGAAINRESGEWRLNSRPLAGGRSIAHATIPLPVGSVAVAERPAGPSLASVEAASWMPPAAAAAHTPAAVATTTVPSGNPQALARAEYWRGLELLESAETNRVQALQEALACFRRAQEVWTRESAPERWAAIQNDVGRVYQEMPDGDRVAHVRAAIAHHHAALDIFDPVSHPINWAWTQSALGAAYQTLPTGSALANARAAIAYPQRALDILTRENAPLAWAWNQNNLATAYEMMRGGADGEWAAHLRDAAQCYEAALEVYTAEAYPVQYQVIVRNLARVHSELKTLE